jgi:hypothetical protein
VVIGDLRADARRNREQVLRTAQQLFAKDGLAVSLDEFARRAGAPAVAADLTNEVASLLEAAHAAGTVRPDATVDDVFALVAGAFAAISHANAQPNDERSAHLAQIILDGLRPQPQSRHGGSSLS